MPKVFTIVFRLFILAIFISLTVVKKINLHYCGKYFYSLSVNTEKSDPCCEGEESPCCHDKTIVQDFSPDILLVSSPTTIFIPVVALLHVSDIHSLAEKFLYAVQPIIPKDTGPLLPLSPPLYIFYHQIVLYH